MLISSTMLLTGCASNNNNTSSNPSTTDTYAEMIENAIDDLDYETLENDSKEPENETKTSKEEQSLIENSGNNSDMNNITETQNTEPQSENITETPKDSETDATSDELEISDLFKDIYLPYAKREKSFAFEAVKTFAQNIDNYDVEIQDPISENIGTITFTDVNGDYVFFAFAPKTSDMYMIMTLSYHQAATNSEVSLGNYSPDCTAEYDIYQTHILGEDEIKVNGPDEQQSFLFQK